LIVDSDPVWLEAVRRWLSAYGLRSIATASNIASANGALAGNEDVVITEVTVARETCFGLVARAVGRSARPAVIAMSDRASRAHVFRLKDFGVHAYLEKPFDASTLYRCLEHLASNVHVRAADREAPDAPTRGNETDAGALSASVEAVVAAHRDRYRLTNSEAEVLRCILRGMRRIEVARERGISINTVKTQVRSLLWKSGATSVRELVRLAAHDLPPRA
jgi:DNA-binding NarL/FixJ family response regulator